MTWQMIPLLLSALLVLPPTAPTAAGDPVDSGDPGDPGDDAVTADAVTMGAVTVRLMPDTTRWVPGRSHLVGVHFELEPGWHLYWPGQNDSGLAIQVIPQAAPESGHVLRTGALRWPAPERLVHPGDLVDHVYNDRVTLLLPVEVPQDAEPGTTLTLVVDTDWLVCEEACLPGAAEVSLSMRVAAPDERPARSRDADQLGATLTRIPGRLPPDIVIEEAGTEGADIRITAPQAARLAFYPAQDGLPLERISASCAALGPRLIIHPDSDPPYRPDADGSTRLKGILEVWNHVDGPSRLSLVDLPAPGADPPTPTDGDEG